MFDKIVLRASAGQPGISVGDLAEALLFYKSVHVILDVWSLKSLTDGFGIQGLLRLLRDKRITAYYAEDMLLTQNEQHGSFEYHWFDSGAISGKPGDKHPRRGRSERLAMMFEMNGAEPGPAWKSAEEYLRRARMGRLSSDDFVKGGIPAAAMRDLDDSNYVGRAMQQVLRKTVGFESFADKLWFEVEQVPSKFRVHTNLNFDKGNAARLSINPGLERINESMLIGAVLSARADITLAAFYGGDFRTSTGVSDIVQIRYADLLRRANASMEEISQFQSIELRNYPRVGEIIDSKARSFDEFLKLLDASD